MCGGECMAMGPRDGPARNGEESASGKSGEMLLGKLLRERLYDVACRLLTSRDGGAKGKFRSPSEELSFKQFAAGLARHAMAVAKGK